MKQILFCYKEDRKLRVRSTILTDVYVPVQDVISPQKTTLTILKTDKVEISDIIIIRDNNSSKIEYIGYIDTITTKTTTEISCYPLINVFDNDYVLDQLYKTTDTPMKDSSGNIVYRKNDNGEYILDRNGNKVPEYLDTEVDVISWLKTQITRAFISTNDKYQALPIIVRNNISYPVFYKKVIDTANLFEVYTDIFINTGVYVEFNELKSDGYYISGIYCDIYCNTTNNPIYLREDNPQIQSVDIVDNTFTNYNKIIATQEQVENEYGEIEPQTPVRYMFYLLDDNSITTDPNASGRFKQVRSKEITFSLDVNDDAEEGLTDAQKDEQRAKALMLSVFNELQAKEYNLAITITMFYNDKIKLHKMVDFVAKNGAIYTSRITKLEILNDKQIKITLGALRNSLTDFKKKVEAI